MRPFHRWLIMYDIRDPARLRKVAKITESCAIRVQYSVFEAFGGRKTIEILRSKLLKVLDEADSVVYIPICVDDWERTVRHGTAPKEHDDPATDEPLFL